MKNYLNQKLVRKREKGIIYSVSSWGDYFYIHTNKDAEDFKIERSKSLGQTSGKYLSHQKMKA